VSNKNGKWSHSPIFWMLFVPMAIEKQMGICAKKLVFAHLTEILSGGEKSVANLFFQYTAHQPNPIILTV